jgi:protein-tyrosine phosphatase
MTTTTFLTGEPCVCPLTGPHLSTCDQWTPTGASWSYGSYRQCEHAQQPVALGWDDETTVYASAHFDKYERTETPDLAIWLADSWRCDVPSFVIDWPDYGLPNLSVAQFLYIAEHALSEIRNGLFVETGCIGGHGRTGTMLACLDVLASGDRADGQESIDYIRSAYCSKAIETKTQEWFIKVIAATVLGTKPPPKPYIPPPKKVPAPKTNVVTIDGLTGKVTSKRADGRTFTYWKGRSRPADKHPPST